MRNVKVLWGINALLFVCLLLVTGMLVMNMRTHPPDKGVQPPPDNIGNPAEDDDLIIASIGDTKITASQLRKVLLQKYGEETLNEMLDRLAVELEGKALGISVTDNDVRAELMTMQLGYEDEEAFYKAMRELGIDKETLQRDAYYKLLTERIATKGIRVSDELVNQYMADHPEEFSSYTQLRPKIIVTSTSEKANAILAELQKGAPFEQLAQDKSLDDITRNDGGDLGWVEENDPFIDDRILQAARSMRPGEVSQPIPLDEGFVIVKLSDRKEVSKEISDQIKEKVRMQLALEQAPPIQDLIIDLRKKYRAQILISSFKQD